VFTRANRVSSWATVVCEGSGASLQIFGYVQIVAAFENGVAVPMSGDDRAARASRSSQPSATSVSAFKRTTSSSGCALIPRLQVRKKPRFSRFSTSENAPESARDRRASRSLVSGPASQNTVT
jgi:hypothetical protein